MLVAAALASVLALAPPFAKIQADFEPLALDFRAEAGKVRLVVLLSPT